MSSVTLCCYRASSPLASSPRHTKPPPSSLSFVTHSSLYFLSKPFKLFLKPLKLTPTKISFPTLLSLPHCHRTFSSSFDSFEENQDEPEAVTQGYDQEVVEEEEINEEEGEESNQGARLYVGNLPYSMNSSELADIFSEAGRVASVEVIYDRVTDRSRGFGFVTMASVEEAKEAIRLLDGVQVGGRTARVNFPEVPKGGEREVMVPKIKSSYKGFIESPHKIYAGNLNWRVTSPGLKDAFTDQPGLLSAKVIFERDTGRSRGFGFVSFASAEDAKAALDALNGVEVEGRPLRLNMAAERSSSPPAPESNAENDPESSELLSSIGA